MEGDPVVHVAETIDMDAPVSVFRIAGGAPWQQVSWEVKAIRDDPDVRARGIVVEIEKEGVKP